MWESYRKTVTVDISSRGVRVLMTRGRRIERWASAPLEPGLMRDGLVVDPVAVGATLRQLMSSSGIRASKVIASVGGQYSLTRVLHLPALDGRTANSQYLDLIKQNMPVQIDDFYLAWQVVGQDDIGQRVFVVAMPHGIIDAQVQALRGAGLSPTVLNLKALAIMKLVHQQQALIVNVEADSADIALAVDGVPMIMRTVTHHAEGSMAERAEELAHDLQQTISFFEMQHPEVHLSVELPVFLVGGQTDSPEVVQVMQEKMPSQLLSLSVPLEHPPNLPVSQYAVNIGLALRPAPSTKAAPQ